MLGHAEQFGGSQERGEARQRIFRFVLVADALGPRNHNRRRIAAHTPALTCIFETLTLRMVRQPGADGQDRAAAWRQIR